MSTILGSIGERFHREGSHTFYDGADGNHDHLIHLGSTSYGEDARLYTSGGVSYYRNGQIFGTGNSYESNGRRYTKVGNILYGPDGKRWYGDLGGEDIRDIISHEN